MTERICGQIKQVPSFTDALEAVAKSGGELKYYHTVPRFGERTNILTCAMQVGSTPDFPTFTQFPVF